MSTPPNKRDQRRQDRLTNLANAQTTRRSEQDSVADDKEHVTDAATSAVTTDASSASAPKTTITGKTTTRPVGTTAGVSKTSTRPTTGARVRTTGVAPGAGKPTTRPVGAVAGKATTRPTAGVKAGTADELVDDTSAGFVTKRDQRRETRRADLARIQEDRRRVRLAQRRKEQRNRWLFIGVTAVIVILFGFWVVKMLTAPGAPSGATASAVTGVPEAGGYGAQILCQSGEQFDQHIHSNLQIVINGKSEPIPAGVGIQTDSSNSVQCYNWLHTHDTTGVVHIESPNKNGQYLLGDFLAVWQKFPTRWIPEGKPVITANSFFGLPIDKTHPVTVYVNKKKFTGDPNSLILFSGENIWLEYGTQQVTPKNYDFAGNGVTP